MDTKNIILQMPFDESDGSTIAYDYSRNRADGIVTGAHFVRGKNGNAISFSGPDTCEITKQIFRNMDVEFSVIAWVQGHEIECGSPRQLIWVLNFDGLENYVEIPIDAKPGSWYSLGFTRRGNKYRFFVNSSMVKELYRSSRLKGFGLHQDFYGGDYGFGLVDDVKIYNVALEQSDLINEISSSKQQSYSIDGIDLKKFGVYVSGSDGLISRPKLKAPFSLKWDNYHGESVDLMHKFYEPREITLHCFVKAGSKTDFVKTVSEFQHLLDKKGTNRLVVDVHPVKPLIYEVYCKDAIEVVKEWSNDLMVGTFKLKLIEPEPVKRILKHIRINSSSMTCKITLTTLKVVNIYWGDGTADFDISGENKVITHDYTINGDYFPVITGCIDEIEKFETNAIVVWERI